MKFSTPLPPTAPPVRAFLHGHGHLRGLVYTYALTTLLSDQSRVLSETLEAPFFRLLKSGSFSNQGVDDTFRLVRDNPQVFSRRGFGGVTAARC
jgi:hypothetical protein